jgi:hypothetical protein
MWLIRFALNRPFTDTNRGNMPQPSDCGWKRAFVRAAVLEYKRKSRMSLSPRRHHPSIAAIDNVSRILIALKRSGQKTPRLLHYVPGITLKP